MEIEDLVGNQRIRTVFQPIVDLDAGTVVAYEALTRGPAGPLERPDLLFAAARDAGLLAELDARCRSAALHNAVDVGICAPLALFVNVEPEVLDVESLETLIEIVRQAPGGLNVVLEITERAIASRPAELLSCVRRLRQAGWRIALDDVGADDMSLAFMPLLEPDVVKLDIKLVQNRPGPAVAAIMNAVNAYAHRSGAILLAEGIEDERHLEIARALGARLGQGWMFGRPSPQLSAQLTPAAVAFADRPQSTTPSSPFGCLPEGVGLRRSTKPLLVELSKHLEREASAHGATCVVVSTFQYAQHFTSATAERYRELAASVGFVAAIGDGLPVEPVSGVRGANLFGDDSLRDEWDIIVLAPHFAAALLARDLGDTGPDEQRRFEFALTYDRDVVAAAAQALLLRVAPSPTSSPPMRGSTVPPASSAQFASVPPAPQLGSANSLQTLQRALAATTNGVSIADVTRPDHPLIYVNAAFERLAGVRSDQILGANCRFLQGAQTDRAVAARIRSAIANGEQCTETLLNYRYDTGEPWWNEITLAPIFDAGGKLVQYIGVQNDVSARVAAETELAHEQDRSAAYLAEMETLAFRDPLTGLLNRRRLFELLDRHLTEAERSGGGVGLLYVDLDGFKQVNDTRGHATGDAVLTAVGRQLLAGSEPDDLIARIGGDEFLIVVPGLSPDDAQDVIRQQEAAVRARLQVAAVDVVVTAGIGCSVFPFDGTDADTLLNAADRRMYDDKLGRGRTMRSRLRD